MYRKVLYELMCVKGFYTRILEFRLEFVIWPDYVYLNVFIK